MKDLLKLTAVEDADLIRTGLSWVREMVDSPDYLNAEWIRLKKWVAAPVESASHFDETDAMKLAAAATSAGESACYTIATEPLENSFLCYLVPMSEEALLDLSWETSQFNFLLTPPDRSFAILCSVWDFFVIAGPSRFVENALGMNIQRARARFVEFASDLRWPEEQRTRLLKIAKWYDHAG
ncbi:MAG: hypothetical protein FJ315_03005 [SAR202 cluster bacterium]|nr:hypothetical protein [SAR202 cluster bacterium]